MSYKMFQSTVGYTMYKAMCINMIIIPSLFSAFSYEAPANIKDNKSFYFKYNFST